MSNGKNNEGRTAQLIFDTEMNNAFENYISDVKKLDFPNDDEQY